MALGHLELKRIIEEVKDFISIELMNKNRTGGLDRYLGKIGFKKENTISEVKNYSNKERSKILIIGDSTIKENVIVAIFREAGISKDRLELILEYDIAEKYNYRKLEYNSDYGAIVFGPIPHSTKDKGTHGSIISKMEEEQYAYPEVVKLDSSGTLKITKSNLQEAIERLVLHDVIRGNL